MNKSKLYMLFGITILILAISGSAYAYYNVAISNDINGTAITEGDLFLDVEKISSSEGDLIPLDNTTEMLNKALLGYGNTTGKFDSNKTCIDKHGYTVCQIYKIYLFNNYTVPVTVSGGVTLTKGTNTPNIACAKLEDINNISSNKDCNTPKGLEKKLTLKAKETKVYYIMIYIKNINDIQMDAGGFNGFVVFEPYNGEQIKARFSDNPALDTLKKLGLSVDTEHTPDFTTISGENGDGTNGIYEAEDDLGTSYYFRGDVENNYVSFADEIWRIIRINGDGTIRMILQARLAFVRGHPYRYNTVQNTRMAVMYMYNQTDDNADIVTTNSNAKTAVDEWYRDNYNYSDIKVHIADAIYCNDIEFVEEDGDGVSTFLRRSTAPTLKCKQKKDRYTVDEDLGNGALTYPIGLPTADEIVMAGGYFKAPSDSTSVKEGDFYLSGLKKCGNYRMLTMTPGYLSFGASIIAYRYGGNILAIQDTVAPACINPVISIKPHVRILGTGTESDPFTISDYYYYNKHPDYDYNY